jgi:uncharacterized protein (DUF362 family)
MATGMNKTNSPASIPVALARCSDYRSPALSETIGCLLETIVCRPGRGSKVLVKPNLLAPKPPDFLACTHPLVVRAACQFFLGLGARVSVGDSPSFGSGIRVSQKIGLQRALADLPVHLVNLDQPHLVRLSFPGGIVALSRKALEYDFILNLPKLKTHRMVRVTGAVKNFFGCVTSVGKALLHFLYGGRGNRFEKMIIELTRHLPPSMSLMDAVVAMHAGGPVDGEPYFLGLLAASPSAVALDTAVFSLLGLQPADVPIWQEVVNQGLPGGQPEEIFFPLELPNSFDAGGFRVPVTLDSLNFHPLRLAKSAIKRTWAAVG